MNTTTTLHIPIDTTVRKNLEAKAKRLGFDSAQAYIRVWAKAEAEGRTLNFGDEWGQPSDEAAERINKASDEAKNGVNISKSFDTAEDFMKDLRA